MLSAQLLQLWFTHASSHINGFVRGAVVQNNQQAGEATHILIASQDFQLDEAVQLAITSVVNRRKAVVRKLQCSQMPMAKEVAGNTATVTDINNNYFLVCCPVFINREFSAVLCAELSKQRTGQSVDVLGEVESAVQWLSNLAEHDLLAGEVRADNEQNARLAVELSSIAISHANAQAAATALASRVSHHMACERVSIGFIEDEHIRLFALSNSTTYETKQNLIKRIESAIQEAVDQTETLVYPATDKSYRALQSHSELSAHHGSKSICTVPLMHDGEVIGGFCFERNQQACEFDAALVQLCEQLTTLVGPVIEYRRRDDKSLSQKVFAALDDRLQSVTGKGHLAGNLVIGCGVIALLAMLFIQWPYKVSANAILEGAIERVVTAPEDGYIETAAVRPGDIITIGQPLVALDDRDLQLEKLKWTGKQQQVSREYREAMASFDRSQIGILRAQLDQAEAQLAILDKKLQRTQIDAPIAGVIVSGDFTRALGSPVDKGQILYKISPLDDYRIVLQVDEAEVAELAVGMKGELTLNASAADSYPFTVDKITPVSRAENGANYFQVEASLDTSPEYLRPGMQGVGKIEAGKRQLLWIWTHRMIDWMRLKLWAWW